MLAGIFHIRVFPLLNLRDSLVSLSLFANDSTVSNFQNREHVRFPEIDFGNPEYRHL